MDRMNLHRMAPTTSDHPQLSVRFSNKLLNLMIINEQMASDLAVASTPRAGHVLRFHCPIRSCPEEFDPDCTYGEFVEHTLLHHSEFFAMGQNICPFGCSVGFVDALQQRQHVVFNCHSTPSTAPQWWPQTCKYPGCQQIYPREGAMRSHYMRKHGSSSYANAKSRFKDDTCQKGFADDRALYLHLIAKSGRGSHVVTIFDEFKVAGMIVYTS